MKPYIKLGRLILPCCLAAGIISCGITRPSGTADRIRISAPHQQINDTVRAEYTNVVKWTDSTGVEHTYTQAEEDSDGVKTVLFNLAEIQVIARSKNVAERNGKIDMNFLVTVPASLISSKWQLQMTPVAVKGKQHIQLDKILLSGADFAKMQKKGMLQYEAFMNSIIPDSMYLKEMFNRKGYRKAMADLENEYYQAWKRDLTVKNEWVDWREKMNRRFLHFNTIMERNRQSIEGSRTVLSVLPAYWLRRELTKRFIPNKYQLVAMEGVSRKKITPKDSARIADRYMDYRRIAENEHKKEIADQMYHKYVRFPYQPARLDTVIRYGDKFVYYYTQEMPVDDDIKKIDLSLSNRVVALDESVTDLPASDTISYYISSMVQFLDPAPRYRKKIISRKDTRNMMAYVHFSQGSAVVDTALDNNREEIAKINDFINRINYSGEFLIDSIYMTATCSPEGSSALNRNLSRERAASFRRYMLKKQDNDVQGLDSILRPRTMGEDWNKLYGLIEKDDSIRNRREILSIINGTADEDAREAAIRRYPDDYRHIYDSLYPLLRGIDFKFHVHRRGMIQDTIVMPVIDSTYVHAIELVRNREYRQALAELADYPDDFNTGIVLMSLGYNSKALEVMMKQPETADRNYLIAILYSRLKDSQQAVRYYLDACQKDERKIYRGKLDPEINVLITKYNLFKDVFK